MTGTGKAPMEGPWDGPLDKAQIDEIVSQVLVKLAERLIASARRRRVLMLFCGAGTGYVAGMQAIRLLSASGYPLTVALSPAARFMITEVKVRQAGATRILADGWVDAPSLVGESELVLIPTLSMNTAAHLALGLMDSLISTLTLGALLAGKPVLAICDGANPYGNGGKVFGANSTAAPVLRARMSDHLSTLMDFGMELVGEGDFLLSLAKRLHATDVAAPENEAPPGIQAPPAQKTNGEQRTLPRTLHSAVVTATDLQGLPYGALVHLPDGARLTPLAHDLSQSLCLQLVYNGH